MTKTLGVAVIGNGYWGKNYVRVLTKNNSTNLLAVCDKFEDRIQDLRKQGVPYALYTDVNRLLEIKDLDAVVISTNPSTHYQLSKMFLEAGKHVLVEKPMTINSEQALELANLAESRGLTLMVGHIFLYNTGIEKLKSYITSGEMGEIYYLYSRRTNLGPIRDDVNVVWDLAPHDISIFNYLLDSTPEWVSANGTTFLHTCCEDVAFIILGYPNGVIGQIHVSWADPNKVREVVVVGSNQRICFNDVEVQEKIKVYEKGVSAKEPVGYGEYQLSIRNGDIFSPNLDISEPLLTQVNHFVDCIFNGNNCRTNGINGYQVVKVCEAANASIKRNGAPVRL
ncbi:MAG: Gfo/Idh/MocA family oxidoreductase [candidate division WOR-3 bacterium]